MKLKTSLLALIVFATTADAITKFRFPLFGGDKDGGVTSKGKSDYKKDDSVESVRSFQFFTEEGNQNVDGEKEEKEFTLDDAEKKQIEHLRELLNNGPPINENTEASEEDKNLKYKDISTKVKDLEVDLKMLKSSVSTMPFPEFFNKVSALVTQYFSTKQKVENSKMVWIQNQKLRMETKQFGHKLEEFLKGLAEETFKTKPKYEKLRNKTKFKTFSDQLQEIKESFDSFITENGDLDFEKIDKDFETQKKLFQKISQETNENKGFTKDQQKKLQTALTKVQHKITTVSDLLQKDSEFREKTEGPGMEKKKSRKLEKPESILKNSKTKKGNSDEPATKNDIANSSPESTDDFFQAEEVTSEPKRHHRKKSQKKTVDFFEAEEGTSEPKRHHRKKKRPEKTVDFSEAEEVTSEPKKHHSKKKSRPVKKTSKQKHPNDGAHDCQNILSELEDIESQLDTYVTDGMLNIVAMKSGFNAQKERVISAKESFFRLQESSDEEKQRFDQLTRQIDNKLVYLKTLEEQNDMTSSMPREKNSKAKLAHPGEDGNFYSQIVGLINELEDINFELESYTEDGKLNVEAMKRGFQTQVNRFSAVREKLFSTQGATEEDEIKFAQLIQQIEHQISNLTRLEAKTTEIEPIYAKINKGMKSKQEGDGETSKADLQLPRGLKELNEIDSILKSFLMPDGTLNLQVYRREFETQKKRVSDAVEELNRGGLTREQYDICKAALGKIISKMQSFQMMEKYISEPERDTLVRNSQRGRKFLETINELELIEAELTKLIADNGEMDFKTKINSFKALAQRLRSTNEKFAQVEGATRTQKQQVERMSSRITHQMREFVKMQPEKKKSVSHDEPSQTELETMPWLAELEDINSVLKSFLMPDGTLNHNVYKSEFETQKERILSTVEQFMLCTGLTREQHKRYEGKIRKLIMKMQEFQNMEKEKPGVRQQSKRTEANNVYLTTFKELKSIDSILEGFMLEDGELDNDAIKHGVEIQSNRLRKVEDAFGTHDMLSKIQKKKLEEMVKRINRRMDDIHQMVAYNSRSQEVPQDSPSGFSASFVELEDIESELSSLATRNGKSSAMNFESEFSNLKNRFLKVLKDFREIEGATQEEAQKFEEIADKIDHQLSALSQKEANAGSTGKTFEIKEQSSDAFFMSTLAKLKDIETSLGSLSITSANAKNHAGRSELEDQEERFMSILNDYYNSGSGNKNQKNLIEQVARRIEDLLHALSE